MIEVALSLIVLIAVFIPLYRFIKRKKKLNQDLQLEDVLPAPALAIPLEEELKYLLRLGQLAVSQS